MNWTKITPTHGTPAKPRRETPAVRRNRTGTRIASVIIPAAMVRGPRFSAYSDGNGKLAFLGADRGEYAGRRKSPSDCALVTIPTKYAHRIPYGTTEVELTWDGDMLVLDLNALPSTDGDTT